MAIESTEVTLMDILEPLSSYDASVMLYVGLLSVEYREVAEDFWEMRHAAFERGDIPRGRTVTRSKAASIAGSKRKRCHGCSMRWALPWPFDPTIRVCSKCTRRGGVPKFQLISATDAFKRFELEVFELWAIDRFHTTPCDNGPHLSGRSMFLFEDVLVLAMSKHG